VREEILAPAVASLRCHVVAQFPIGLLAKDCGELALYESLSELEEGVEIIDVENDEYAGWDAANYSIRLAVHSAKVAQGWLRVDRASAEPQAQEFIRAVEQFATSAGVSATVGVGEQPIEFLRRVEGVTPTQARRPSGWRGLFRRG